ncbi:MAG: magnesium transporter [Rhodospirillaceae bacterium]|nr:magnesium transporter [Rhodospirillaceae bacterium]
MTAFDKAQQNDTPPVSITDEDVTAEDFLVLSPDRVRLVAEALDANDSNGVFDVVRTLNNADTADLIEHLSGDHRNGLIDLLHGSLNPEVLAELDETVREQVVKRLDAEEVAAAISGLESDDALEVIEDLHEDIQQQILQEIPTEERVILEDSLSYPEESAGRLMQRKLVSVPEHWTVGEIIDFLRSEKDLPQDFYDIFIVDPKHQPVGSVPLSRVLRSERSVRGPDIMETRIKPVEANMDQEEVARLFRRHNLISAPVIDPEKRLIGVITVDDVVDVIDEEAGEDIMRLGGVKEEDFYSAFIDTTRSRFTWLLVNLATAFLASFVIFQFESTISKVVALAVLMPIVASMGGNAGTQTLTVAVRALAMKELNPANLWRSIGKEFLVSLVNGLLFAGITGLVCWWWFDWPEIGFIIAAAMIINIVVAGLSGMGVPLILERLNIDPAIASGTFLTTMTDVVGFLSFLGLAAWFLL